MRVKLRKCAAGVAVEHRLPARCRACALRAPPRRWQSVRRPPFAVAQLSSTRRRRIKFCPSAAKPRKQRRPKSQGELRRCIITSLHQLRLSVDKVLVAVFRRKLVRNIRGCPRGSTLLGARSLSTSPSLFPTRPTKDWLDRAIARIGSKTAERH